ncbi:reverse transcriptase [Elysia marginata]|uniref:Reverse transcriptase n=1 Tax=Elysia marginata TaxID=1093978 RepID=A0AAV4IKM8_9GAST|nr:reverse transcriptase [Elysia marginata]
MLVLLDLSAAFDTIDQDCLLHGLQKQFGIKGVALKWLASYMSERSQAVQINPRAVSSTTCQQFGVPQGNSDQSSSHFTQPLGLSNETRNNLKKMQSKAAKLVTRAKARDHVQPILHEHLFGPVVATVDPLWVGTEWKGASIATHLGAEGL